jgi:hypothetical protein
MGTLVDFSTGLGTLLSAPTAYLVADKRQSDPSATTSSPSIGAVAGRGAATMTGSLVKGTLVTVPTALADGLHNVPKLYGEDVVAREPITDWKSGHKVAAKVSNPATGPTPALRQLSPTIDTLSWALPLTRAVVTHRALCAGSHRASAGV